MSALNTSRAAQCQGKQAFNSRYAAEMVSKGMKGTHTYRCPDCHQYHIGNTNKRQLGHPLGRRPAVPVDGFED